MAAIFQVQSERKAAQAKDSNVDEAVRVLNEDPRAKPFAASDNPYTHHKFIESFVKIKEQLPARTTEEIMRAFANAIYDVKQGSGKGEELPETKKARESISGFAGKMTPKEENDFICNLAVQYAVEGEPAARRRIIEQGAGELGRIAKIGEPENAFRN